MKQKIFLLGLLFFFISASGIRGGEDFLEITIDVLEPTDQPGEIDPGIKYLEDEMSRSPLKFQNYLTLATAFRRIRIGEETKIDFKLRRKLEIVIIPKKISAETSRFSLRLLTDGNLVLDTEMTLVHNGTVMIGASGHPNLIIAISEGF